MAIVRWDPWREVAALERQLDQAFGRFSRASSAAVETRTWAPAVDVYEEGDDMVICADLAGIAPEDVDITVQDSILRISGTREDDSTVSEGNWIRRERFVGRFQRDIALPQGIDPGSIHASNKNGVVSIRVPQPRSAAPHRVELTADEAEEQVINLDDTSAATSESTKQQDAPAPS